MLSAGYWKLETPSSSIHRTQFPQGDAEEIQKVKIETLTEVRNVLSDDLWPHTCAQAWRLRHREARSQEDLSVGEAGLPSNCRAQSGRSQRGRAQQAAQSHCRPLTSRARRAVCVSGLVLQPLWPSRESVTRKPANKMPPPLTRFSRRFLWPRVLWPVRSMCDVPRDEQSYKCMEWTRTGLPEHHGADSRSLVCTLSAQ